MKIQLFCLIFVVFLISVAENKKVKNENIKAEKIKDKVPEKKVKTAEPIPMPDLPKNKTPEPTKPAKQEPKITIVKKVKHVQEPPIIEEPTIKIIEEIVSSTVPPKKPIKTKYFKALTDYEQCKLECKKKRDQVNAEEYVVQLEEELKLAKENLAKEQEAQWEHETVVKMPAVDVETRSIPPSKLTTETADTGKPIIEVTLQQPDHDEL
uniref:Uncharacterized protein n=1 Tax=Panagrolaimus sp. JU765 TaxID=591449 RepID=A0AC34RGH2_9BILA